jgi:hypothetical protein
MTPQVMQSLVPLYLLRPNRRKSFGEAALLKEERSSINDDGERVQDYFNSTIALMLRSDRGSQAFPTFKDRQNKDSISPMVVEFTWRHRNISAVYAPPRRVEVYHVGAPERT